VGKNGTARRATYENIIRRREGAIYLPENEAKYRDTHAQYLIILALPWQKWLRERA
jgi:hypothetical protein